MTGVAGEGGTLSFSVQTQPGNGTLSATGADFEYTPDADFNGTDSFTFTVSEGSLTSAAATITLEVAPVNDAPVAASSNLAATEDVALQDDVTASDVDGDALTLTIVTQPANGAVTPGSGTAFTYQPVADFFGQETFTFTISDGVETTSEETVTIDVAPVNDLPVVTDIADTVTAGTPVTFDLTGTDVENDALNYSLSSNFSKSTVTNDFSTSAMIELTPDYGEWGPDSALYVANDGVGDSAPASIDLEIEVPQTTGTLDVEFYDGNGQADGSSIIEGAADRVYHTGVVRGDFTPGSTVTDEQQYIAIYDAANGVRINEIYLDGPIDERSIATGFVDDRLVTAGSVLGDPTSIHVITLDANDAVDVDEQVIVPYAIVRDFQSFELAHAPGIGFFVIGNDNQLSFIDYEGVLLSTVALPSPPSTEVQAYEVQDVRVIGNTVYIAGFIFECGDDPAMCNSGIGAMGFLITVGTDGAGPQVVGLGTSFTSDSLILDDGTLLQQRRPALL